MEKKVKVTAICQYLTKVYYLLFFQLLMGNKPNHYINTLNLTKDWLAAYVLATFETPAKYPDLNSK